MSDNFYAKRIWEETQGAQIWRQKTQVLGPTLFYLPALGL